jgi:hypothetical protein
VVVVVVVVVGVFTSEADLFINTTIKKMLPNLGAIRPDPWSGVIS